MLTKPFALQIFYSELAGLRIRNRAPCAEKRLRSIAANELGYRKHRCSRNLLRLQPARRPMELEDACCSPMDLPSQYMPSRRRDFTHSNLRRFR